VAVDRVDVERIRPVMGVRRGPSRSDLATVLLAIGVLAGALTVGRGWLDTRLSGAGAAPGSALSASSASLQSAISTGAGVGFFAVQRTTEYQRAGGSPIPVVDPSEPTTVVGQTDRLFVNAMMSKGFVTATGFFMDMRPGTETSSAADFDAAPPLFSVLADGTASWRDDGHGWYATDVLPGLGIDLATARLLPRALGRVGSLAAAGSETVNGTQAAVYTGTVTVADVPGVVASPSAASVARLWGITA
jgi:hypothetical protein